MHNLACKLVSELYSVREALASMAPTTNISASTSVADDHDLNRVFARQVEVLANTGDIVVGISTNCYSPNVIEDTKEAKRRGAVTIAFTGASGGKMKRNVYYLLTVSPNLTSHVQVFYIMVGHIIRCLVEKELFENKNVSKIISNI